MIYIAGPVDKLFTSRLTTVHAAEELAVGSGPQTREEERCWLKGERMRNPVLRLQETPAAEVAENRSISFCIPFHTATLEPRTFAHDSHPSPFNSAYCSAFV
jgi:hypothetical protein